MVLRSTLVFLLLFFFQAVSAKVIDVGILTDRHTTAVSVLIKVGGYFVQTDGGNKLSLEEGDRLVFSSVRGMVSVKMNNGSVGVFNNAELIATDFEAVFSVTSLPGQKTTRYYDDDLQVHGKRGRLLLINRVNLEKYVAGVVESEAGKDHSLEFYKAQAVVSRTYALNNLQKLRHLGYNLNDLVDCQVYHGKSRFEPLIKRAVRQTRGQVLVDASLELITAAFHSNSGGETVDVEEVWTVPRSYLRGRIDSFSQGQPHFRWSRTIKTSRWLNYLVEQYALPANDESLRKMVTCYRQDHRNRWFVDRVLNISLEQVRRDWRLESTYFDIAPVAHGDSLHFTGRGFGHAIGLSQEGAMKMAGLDYSYKQILFYYYTDVHLVDYKLVALLRGD